MHACARGETSIPPPESCPPEQRSNIPCLPSHLSENFILEGKQGQVEEASPRRETSWRMSWPRTEGQRKHRQGKATLSSEPCLISRFVGGFCPSAARVAGHIRLPVGVTRVSAELSERNNGRHDKTLEAASSELGGSARRRHLV